MEESFKNCGRVCRRWTLDDGDPVEVETHTEESVYRGKPVTALVTVWKGAHMLDDGQRVWRVTRSETWDGGPMGLTLTYSVQKQSTARERRENRKHLKAVIEQLFPGYTLVEPHGA